MREFNHNEQQLIKNKLAAKDGTILDRMFSDTFLKEAKLTIDIEVDISPEDEQHRLTICSDTYSPMEALEEFIDVIDLLIYLDSEKLISKYPPPAASLRNFDIKQQLTIGDSASTKCNTFLLTRASNYVIDFIRHHDNYTFHAKPHLQEMMKRKFISDEGRRHTELVKNGRDFNRILFFTLIASIIVSALSYKSNNTDSIRKDMDSLKVEVAKMKQHMLFDPKCR